MNFLRFVWFYALALNCIIQLSAFIWLCGSDTYVRAADTLRNVHIAVSSVSPVSFNGFNSPLMGWNCMSHSLAGWLHPQSLVEFLPRTGRWKRNRINKWQVLVYYLENACSIISINLAKYRWCLYLYWMRKRWLHFYLVPLGTYSWKIVKISVIKLKYHIIITKASPSIVKMAYYWIKPMLMVVVLIRSVININCSC